MGILFLILFATYFLPSFIAMMRSHHQFLAIFLLNLFLGWTVVGWVCALVWSAMQPPQTQPVYYDPRFDPRRDPRFDPFDPRNDPRRDNR